MTKNRLALIGFLALTVGGGLAIGFVTAPGAWYAALEKPPFNPPNWLFGPVWTALYVLIGVVGWRLWTRARDSWAMRHWWLQLALNFAWSPVFFGLRRVDLAMAVILALLATTLALIAAAARRDRTSAWLTLPYAAWVAFAAILNGAILLLNR